MKIRICVCAFAFAVCMVLSGCATTLDRRAVGLAEQRADTPGFDDGRFYELPPDFYFTGLPTERGFEYFKDRNVGLVINLCTEQEMAEEVKFSEPELVRSLGMRYESLPVTPETFSLADVDRFEQLLKTTRGPVAVHCSSSNRVGGLWAAYLAIKRGMPTEQAIEYGRSAGLRRDTMIEAVQEVIRQSQAKEHQSWPEN